MTIKCIVAGGRDFKDYPLLESYLDHLFSTTDEEIILISGKARGADSLGERYAREHGFCLQEFPADWDLHGKSAGYKRNREMAQNATHCVIFWDGQSKGTAHMIDLAEQYQLKLRVQHYN